MFDFNFKWRNKKHRSAVSGWLGGTCPGPARSGLSNNVSLTTNVSVAETELSLTFLSPPVLVAAGCDGDVRQDRRELTDIWLNWRWRWRYIHYCTGPVQFVHPSPVSLNTQTGFH